MKIEIVKLAKVYNGQVIFKGLSWHVEPGQAHVVVGPNGSGKSTFLRIVCGLLRPSSGEVRMEIEGQLIKPEQRGQYLGLVSPDLNFYEQLSAFENLQFFAALRGSVLNRDGLLGLLKRVQLESASHRAVATFSSGMKQRLKLAFALLHQPPVLVLDEPTSNLDDAGRTLVDEIINEQLEQSIVIIATNEPGEVEKYGHRILRLGAALGRNHKEGFGGRVQDTLCH